MAWPVGVSRSSRSREAELSETSSATQVNALGYGQLLGSLRGSAKPRGRRGRLHLEVAETGPHRRPTLFAPAAACVENTPVPRSYVTKYCGVSVFPHSIPR